MVRQQGPLAGVEGRALVALRPGEQGGGVLAGPAQRHGRAAAALGRHRVAPGLGGRIALGGAKMFTVLFYFIKNKKAPFLGSDSERKEHALWGVLCIPRQLK